ncbi:hypothetical protein [Terrisporobacter glycolicus]|uniref:Glycosyltransferase 2-like domain-containing protein n=1 Tax=Terrisporobacter glycolicus ATCC 14880 = DSM 1288 TaxID=1121315 RepID=A0ABZ2F004_9FIRM|nr:hypothetical protein [Terrisporobacter glycolicus]
MNKKVIVQILLNTRFDINSQWGKISLTKEWIDYRIDIFMKYTAKSLINQSNQDFITIVRYWDSSEDLVLDALSKYKPLPNNILFKKDSEADEIINDYIKDSDIFYIVRIDSDDMYAPDFMGKLNEMNYYDGLQCIICQDGYVYDVLNDRLAMWHYFSPPFYTFVYKTLDYLSGERYVLEGGHCGAIKLNHEILSGLNFVFLVHEKNISSRFDNRPDKKIIESEEKEIILKELMIPRRK